MKRKNVASGGAGPASKLRRIDAESEQEEDEDVPLPVRRSQTRRQHHRSPPRQSTPDLPDLGPNQQPKAPAPRQGQLHIRKQRGRSPPPQPQAELPDLPDLNSLNQQQQSNPSPAPKTLEADSAFSRPPKVNDIPALLPAEPPKSSSTSGHRDSPILLDDDDSIPASVNPIPSDSKLKSESLPPTSTASPSKARSSRSTAKDNVHLFLQQHHLDSEENAALLLKLGFRNEEQFLNTFSMGEEQLLAELWSDLKADMTRLDYATLKGVVKRKLR